MNTGTKSPVTRGLRGLSGASILISAGCSLTLERNQTAPVGRVGQRELADHGDPVDAGGEDARAEGQHPADQEAERAEPEGVGERRSFVRGGVVPVHRLINASTGGSLAGRAPARGHRQPGSATS